MIKVVMKDSEDLLIDGNHIERSSDDYLICQKTSNGILNNQTTVAVIKQKDVKMIYKLNEGDKHERIKN